MRTLNRDSTSGYHLWLISRFTYPQQQRYPQKHIVRSGHRPKLECILTETLQCSTVLLPFTHTYTLEASAALLPIVHEIRRHQVLLNCTVGPLGHHENVASARSWEKLKWSGIKASVTPKNDHYDIVHWRRTVSKHPAGIGTATLSLQFD